MTTIIKAILQLNSNAQVTVLDNDIDRIKWSDGNPTNITKEQILTKQTELQAEYDAKQYQRDREVAYPTIQEQLDMQYWDNVNGTTTWKDAIAKVKSDNPKE
jgi:hypothetical protein|tara:strand:- start:45 stop:350 length:306 start_codon:yes stop_codon:yes gene_type:complete